MGKIKYTEEYRKELIGKRFGRLVIQDIYDKPKKEKYYYVMCKCLCDCGNESNTYINALINGSTTSCGCFGAERRLESTTKHNEAKCRLYKIWQHMKIRAKENTKYKSYEKLGIKICDEWRNDYIIFRDWALKNGYRDDLSIDRIDTYGNYEPRNCRFADYKTQVNNRTVTIYLTDDNGVRKCLSEWCDFYGVTYKNASTRLERGWEFKDIFRKEIGKSRNGRKSRRVVK